MYIITETIAGNDPRLQEGMEYIGDFWHYQTYFINEGVYIDWLDYIEITEDQAKSYKLCAQSEGELSLSGPATGRDNAIGGSDTGDSKWIYQLNLEDHQNTIVLMEAATKLYANKWLQNKEVLPQLLAEIKDCKSVDQMQQWMTTYMPINFHSCQGKKLKKRTNAIFNVEKLQLPSGAY